MVFSQTKCRAHVVATIFVVFDCGRSLPIRWNGLKFVVTIFVILYPIRIDFGENFHFSFATRARNNPDAKCIWKLFSQITYKLNTTVYQRFFFLDFSLDQFYGHCVWTFVRLGQNLSSRAIAMSSLWRQICGKKQLSLLLQMDSSPPFNNETISMKYQGDLPRMSTASCWK